MDGHAHTDNRSNEHVGGGWQLLPGIPNEATFDLIIPKLQWKDFHVLSSVSRCWREAIQTKQVYEARVRANSTDTLIAHYNSSDEPGGTLSLYYTGEKCWYKLPPIPWLPGGSVNAMGGHCIALGGKLYVFAGERVLRDGHRLAGVEGCDSRGDVFVLDLAGQREWKQCASMLDARSNFGCGVMDGKIYIFGGTNKGDVGGQLLFRSEVYDPQENAWSPIMPMPMAWTSVVSVATVGKELFLHPAASTEMLVYNPAKNEWRVIKYPCDLGRYPVFIFKEKLYSFYRSGIDVYDVEQQTWMNQHTNSFLTVKDEVTPLAILVAKDELWVTALHPTSKKGLWGTFRAKGLDIDKKEVVWEGTGFSISRFVGSSAIQL